MISVIDMPPPDESIWWRGKRGFQVGFFPCECVQVIGDKVPQAIHPQALTLPAARGHATNAPPPPAHAITHAHTLHGGQQAPTKPVLRKHGKLIAFFRSFILSRPSRRKLKQSGILRERVFGCDLGEHLLNSGHEIPMVLKCCAEFIESHGVVDGIYRLSGITSNIQKLRNAFDEDRIPDLYGDEGILQDIHCVSSVLKMYFRELPNPLLTYQLYDKFVAAVMQEEDIRLLYVRDVVQQLPPPHYRTLEYLVQHLARVASNGQQTGMTPKNIAIVWAPNLLRSKDLDMGGVAALQDVGTQAVVTEYLVRYVDLIFNDKIPTFSHSTNGVDGTPRKCRPKSLAISTPTKLISIEEARTRALGNSSAVKADQKYIEVGGGPNNLPPKYHTVIELPNRKGGSLKQKKSPLGWKSIFGKGRSVHKHQRKASTPSEINLNINDPMGSEADVAPSSSKRLRPVKSVESLVSTSASLHSNRNSQVLDSPERRAATAADRDGNLEDEDEYRRGRSGGSSGGSSPLKSPQDDSDSSRPSPRTHSRSVSHDSYFNRAGEERTGPPAVQLAVSEEGESDLEFSPENSKIFLDISELNLDFNTSEKEMKIFSEDETLKSTSIEDGDSMSRSMQDVENVSMGSSDVNRSRDNLSPRNDKRSLKDKLKRFTSPASQRRAELPSDSGDDINTNSLKRASTTIRDKIAHALSPETSRRRPEMPPSLATHRGSASPLGSPKLKHVRTTPSTAPSTGPSTGPSTAASSSSALDADEPISLSSVSMDMKGEDPGGGGGGGGVDEGGREETVIVEVHAGLDDEDARSRQSIESALIDPELMAKLTHMRSSPSVSNSEGGSSSVSMAEATVSDNESFTLGSSSAHGELGGGGSEGSSLPPVSTLTTPGSPPVTLVLGTPVEDQEVLTPQPQQDESKSQSRPTSLLGIPTSDLLTCALASPETPQGDSTFLEIQYHPLSDTTEPSTPSESQFVQDLVAVHTVLPVPKDQDDHPRQSSPLSPDISSDEPTDEQDVEEDGPLYENVEASSTLTPIIASQPSSLTPSLPQDDDFEDDRAHSITPQPRYSRSGFSQDSPVEGEVTYENVEYGAEYENVPGGITPTVTVVAPIGREEPELGQRPEGGVSPHGYEDVVTTEGVTLFHTNEEITDEEPKAVYENIDQEPQPTYENIDDEGRMAVKGTAVHEGPRDTDHAYEEYSFGPEHEYENVEFPSTVPASGQQQSTNAQQPQAPEDRTEAEVEGEIVYQQVKFLKRSIQEVNELLRDSSSDPPSSLESSPLEDSESILSDDSTPLAEDKAVVQSPTTATTTTTLPKVEESGTITVEISPAYPDEGAEEGESAADEDVEAAAAADDSECLDSPVSPSTASLPTEVMVLPSFSSPTESTTDDVTSPPSSESLASPHKGVPSSLPQPLASPTSVPTLLPQLSPSPDPQPRQQQQQDTQQPQQQQQHQQQPPVAGSSNSVSRSKLSTILTPAPWPRSTPRHMPIVAPVAKPRQLPYVSPLSPLISPDDTSVSPDSSATPDTPTTPVEDEEVPLGISLIGNTQDLSQVLQPMTQPSPQPVSQPQPPTVSQPQLPTVSQPQPPTASHPQPPPVSQTQPPTVSQPQPTTTSRAPPPEGADAEVPLSQKPASEPIPIPLSRTSSTRSGDSRDPASASPPARPPLPTQLTSLQRYKTSPDMRTGLSRAESEPPLSSSAGEENFRTGGTGSESEEPRPSAESRTYVGSLDLSDPEKRERIERYKEERRTFLREKYKSESFRGEKDEMLLRLKQKATSPSRPEEEESLPLECPGSPKRRVLGSTPPSKNLEEPHGTDTVSDRPKDPEETNGETRTEGTAEEVKDFARKKPSPVDLPLKRTSPTRRSLSDMGRVGGGESARSPGKGRSSSDSSAAPPVFRRSASTDVTSPRTSLRKLPDKEPITRKHSTGIKPGTGRAATSPKSSPIKSPPGSPFRKSSSTHGGVPGVGARRTSAKDETEDDLNVKERAALWTQRREKSPTKEGLPRSPDKPTGPLKLERKASHDSCLRREAAGSSTSSGIPISPTRKSSLPKAVVARQSSSSSITSSASSSYDGHHGTGSSSSPAAASPTTPGGSNSSSGSCSVSGTNLRSINVSGAAVAQQQRRIRDMAAIFERDTATAGAGAAAKPVLLRQASREDKRDR